eukprot:gnl/TRDRNA2_/TRDRNA2_145297_c0_seq5.p1 gnl/TRDRNA2_/TRDRNA2_145297_c0~~gnl/TRDRNA2_/TRDRNA2_145297_c0_seq5.p1  ORF type:complete len:321 (-),score=35.36 gnl/TRDRNA2_/TRDRNA2_145297_c0_seq5:71-1033(-)
MQNISSLPAAAVTKRRGQPAKLSANHARARLEAVKDSAVAHAGPCSRVLPKIRLEIMPALFAFFVLLFAYDAAHNRLGSSNGKFISFVDTVLNVYNFRHGLRDTSRRSVNFVQGLRIVVCSFFVKFAAQTAVSLILGKVPVVLQGWRHTSFFFFGLALIWLSPSDVIYQHMRVSRAVRLMLQMGQGLYKMRKVIFAVEAAGTGKGSFVLALLVSVLSIDGSTLTRRAVLWLERQREEGRFQSAWGQWLVTPKACRSSPGAYATNSYDAACVCESPIARRFAKDGCKGVRQALFGTFLPLFAITAVVWTLSHGCRNPQGAY